MIPLHHRLASECCTVESGGRATLLHHHSGSDGLTMTAKDIHQVRMVCSDPLDEGHLRHLWNIAGEGLRCGDVDIVLFPIC